MRCMQNFMLADDEAQLVAAWRSIKKHGFGYVKITAQNNRPMNIEENRQKKFN